MILDRVRATGLVVAGAPLAVLLSGGRDSVCLLDVCVSLGADVTALHVNYGLREDADLDERLCAATCARLEVPLVVERPERPDGGNLQAWARDVRYAAALALGGDVAAGHTATDQAETILYRLAASPGRRALLGMSPREGRVVRPLLAVTRDETGAHCTARGLTFREDPSNASDAFARNRVRAGLVEELRRVHPAAEANVVRTAALLREEAAVLDELVATALGGGDGIALDHLAALPRALARLIVRRLAEDATGALCARAATRLDDVLALDDGALDLGDGARAHVAGGILRIVPTPPLPARTG
ncbi:MAG TPA: tRNA lysidine(34) synthetase TilS [Solirubrobacteraceae bacterium]